MLRLPHQTWLTFRGTVNCAAMIAPVVNTVGAIFASGRIELSRMVAKLPTAKLHQPLICLELDQ